MVRNPFKPGAGHMPPYLAGRNDEQQAFKQLLAQNVVTQNLVLTGLRGVGKTVLLETLKPIAIDQNWLWTGTDMSESASISENRLATRLLTDISIIAAPLLVQETIKTPIGFNSKDQTRSQSVGFHSLKQFYDAEPGLEADKLKSLLRFLWEALREKTNGIVFAYDEAQVLEDHAGDREFPLSMLLEVFQSIQKQGIPFLLVLTGLPTLTSKLVEARTYSERMFKTVTLSQLDPEETKQAIIEPTQSQNSPLRFEVHEVNEIAKMSSGYPYFIQYISREFFDACIANINRGQRPNVPKQAIIAKLDNDFFTARWERATDRERDLMFAISQLDTCNDEFTVSEIIKSSRDNLARPFSPSSVSQMLGRLGDKGLIFKSRHGKYSFAVPLLAQFIRRQVQTTPDLFETPAN
ncbi:MAG: ATP-binding protein [Pseudomonadota bacterium]